MQGLLYDNPHLPDLPEEILRKPGASKYSKGVFSYLSLEISLASGDVINFQGGFIFRNDRRNGIYGRPTNYL